MYQTYSFNLELLPGFKPGISSLPRKRPVHHFKAVNPDFTGFFILCLTQNLHLIQKLTQTRMSWDEAGRYGCSR